MKLILLFTVASARFVAAGSAPCVAIDGDWAQAGDLSNAVPEFRTLDAHQPIFTTPGPGARRLISMADLSRILTPTPDFHSQLCLERRLRVLTATDFRNAIETALKSELPTHSFLYDLVEFDHRPMPSGHLEFSMRTLRFPPSDASAQSQFWPGTLIYSDHRSIPTWVRVRQLSQTRVCRLIREIAAGDGVSAADCRFETTANLPTGAADPGRLEGKVASHHLAQGSILRSSHLSTKLAVRSGQKARLTVVSGSAQISIEARVSGSAQVGQMVMVTNPMNGHHLNARVVGEGLLEVHLQ